MIGDLTEKTGVIRLGHWNSAGKPFQQERIGYLKQSFEFFQLGGAQCGDRIIGEISQDQIHFTHAAMPRAETGPFSPAFHCFWCFIAIGHYSISL